MVYANSALGRAHCVAQSWEDAASCLERALAVAREEEVGLLEEPLFLARLAEAYGGLGDGARATETVERALLLARERRLPTNELVAQIMRSRVLRQARGARARAAIESTLTEAQALVDSTGARSWQPFIHLERAELARLTGDSAARERELREAHRLFAEMGAERHVERLARELGP